jgi:hypothetical protein
VFLKVHKSVHATRFVFDVYLNVQALEHKPEYVSLKGVE